MRLGSALRVAPEPGGGVRLGSPFGGPMDMHIPGPRRQGATFILCTFACIAALGCTKAADDGDDDGNTPSAGSGGANVPTAGIGGTGAGGSGAGGAGGAAGMAAPAVTCGGKMCMPVAAGGMMVPACCDMAHGNLCGATIGVCVGLGQPGTDDATCPMEMSAAMTMLPGCC